MSSDVTPEVRDSSSDQGGRPKLSIICVTYNHGRFIEDALNGFLAQRVSFPLEIIIGDDASTDGTAQTVAAFAARHPGLFTTVLRKRNLGAIPNFVDLLPWIRGSFVALCDGDDYWTDPLKLKKQVDFLESNARYSLCFHLVSQEYDDGSQAPLVDSPFDFCEPEARARGFFTIRDILRINFMASLSVVYRWNLPAVPPWMARHSIGDYPLHLLHAARGDIGFLPEVMGVYRRHHRGLWWNHQSRAHRLRYGQDYRDLLIDVDNELKNTFHEEFAATIAAVQASIDDLHLNPVQRLARRGARVAGRYLGAIARRGVRVAGRCARAIARRLPKARG